MTKKLYLFISIIIVGLALFLRLSKLENRAPFDWDQNRDYTVISAIVAGKATLIGPVAKGEGGFFLGPLYYYLATPAYLLMSGSPLALPLTSVIIDVITTVAILILLRKLIGDWSTLSLASIWALSWFTIEMSRISWNVSLVPLWSIIFIWLLSQKSPLSIFKVGLLGFMVGLSWHIHAAIIPISLIILVINWRLWAKNLRYIALLVGCYLIALIPLILFDLRHSGLNLHLLTQVFAASGHASTTYLELLSSVLMRFGKNIQNLLLGIPSYQIFLGSVFALIAGISLVFDRGIYRLAGLIIILNILAVIALKEIGFPEYYLAVSYLPTLLIFNRLISYLSRGNQLWLIIITLILIFLNVRKYEFSETTFSVSRKIGVAKLMVSLSSPLDLRLIMAPGREGGIKAFYKLYGGKLDTTSPLKVIVTDQSGGPIIEGGELATDIGNFGGIRVAKIVVE